MLLIDKQNSVARLIVTVSEVAVDGEAGYTLVVHSTFNNTTHSISLPSNTSPHPSRYDEFLVATTEFGQLGPGTYQYTILNGSAKLKQGVLKVVDGVETEQQYQDNRYITLTPAEDADDFVVLDK